MESKNNEKKVLIFSTIAVVLLIIVVVGATYAFFTAQGGASANTNVNVQTNTTDNLSFSVGDAISITANQQNFAQGAGNQAGSTTASATLTANNATNMATRNYYLYLNIASNDFVYTVDENTPELLLTIIDPEGNPVTSLAGLNYKTDVTTNVTDGDAQTVSGFDITTKTGSITIADNYEIASTGTVTQEWNVTVTFINLDSDQEGNTNKTFEASLVIREDSPIGITNVSTSNITSDSITLTVNAESENTITNYYFAKNEEEYVSSANNTYTFTGLDAATEYTLKAYAVDDEGYQSAVYSTEVSTTDYTLADVCPEGGNLASCIQTYYTTYGEETGGIYYHDGVGTYTNANQEAGDNSYRYSGANPNNYVCFGVTGADCQNANNQYRIIGVFNNQVKLIKATSIGNYTWDADDVNTWDETTKPNIHRTLNTTYYNTLGNEWQNLIAESTWHVGGMPYSDTNTAKQYYDIEVGTGLSGYEETMKIGLMYVSDYGYVASPENWTTPLRDYNNSTNTDNNWLYLGNIDWTISRRSDSANLAFIVRNHGHIFYNTAYYVHGVRPSFYLATAVEISSGTGSSTDPFILNLN